MGNAQPKKTNDPPAHIPVSPRRRFPGVAGYFNRTLGSLPHNLGIGLVQAVTEAVVDSARVCVELAKAPGRYLEGDSRKATEETLQGTLDAAFEGVVNTLKNVVQPLYRSHQMGMEDPEMMDPGQAVQKSIAELSERFKLLGTSLTPEQKSDLVRKVKTKVKEVAPDQADKAARQVREALGGIGKKKQLQDASQGDIRKAQPTTDAPAEEDSSR